MATKPAVAALDDQEEADAKGRVDAGGNGLHKASAAGAAGADADDADTSSFDGGDAYGDDCVVLRYEVASRREARALQYSMWGLTVLLMIGAIVFLAVSSSASPVTIHSLRKWYVFQLALGVVCLVTVMALGAAAVVGTRRAIKSGKRWRRRQWQFCRSALVLLGVQTLHNAIFVTSYSVAVATLSCEPPWQAVAALNFLRRTCVATMLFLFLNDIYAMTAWRGKGALDMPPDAALAADQPFFRRGPWQWGNFAVWGLIELAAMLNVVSNVHRGNEHKYQLCNDTCPSSSLIKGAAGVFLVLAVVFYVLFSRHSRRALADHSKLPWGRYRESNIFIRVQTRLMSAILVSVVAAIVVVDFGSAFGSTCFTIYDMQLGNVVLQITLTLACFNQALLFTPSSTLDSPLQNVWLQEFSWAEADMPADKKRRSAHLRQISMHASAGALERLAAGAVDALGRAEPTLSDEPLFCVELACRTFYWARAAYLYLEPGSVIRKDVALRLFGLTDIEDIFVKETETRCIIGWGPGMVVLAFRGTKNLKNMVTDVKFFRTFHEPRRRRDLSFVMVHTGFYAAWRGLGFNERVLERVAAAVEAAGAADGSGALPPRFVITGHSLGGALACLGAYDIHRAFPKHRMAVYTFGTPRVGNRAFSADYIEAVPDTWALVNRKDPIPRIPSGLGYKRCGERVTINPQGDMIVRPSYFEMSLISRGNIPADHRTAGYALSLTAMFKAQFMPSKRMPGGAEGVARLCAAVDVGEALTLRRVDLASLRDPDIAPEVADPPKKPKRLQREKRQSAWQRCWPGKAVGASGSQEESTLEAAAAALSAEDAALSVQMSESLAEPGSSGTSTPVV